MTYQEGAGGDLVIYTPPSATIGFQRVGQIIQTDAGFFYVEVFRQRPFSVLGNFSAWLTVAPGTIERFDPQYCRKA